MYCPGCAAQATDETNYCNQCGANLRTVREALMAREPDETFDWSKTWLVDMLLSEDERRRRTAAAELAGSPENILAAEIKRRNELKAGLITCFAGIGGAIFLAILGGAISGPPTGWVLENLWAVALIPIMVGLAIILNTLFADQLLLRARLPMGALRPSARPPARTTGELPALEAPPLSMASVTEHTTAHLVEPDAVRREPGRPWLRE